MKRYCCFFSLLFLMMIATPAWSQQKVEGIWWSPSKDAKIKIYKRNGLYYGKLVWVKTPRKDTENPDESLRNRPLKGLEFMKNFKYNPEEEKWVDGSIYDAESGNTYDSMMWLEGEDKLMLRGYMGVSWLGRTETFTRVEE